MKNLLIAAIAALATAAPLQAVERAFVVKSVHIRTLSGKRPLGAPSFKKGAVVKLEISEKKVTGPQEINAHRTSKSAIADTYHQVVAVGGENNVTVRKNRRTKRVTEVELVCNRPVIFYGDVTVTGQVAYMLAPK